MVGGATRANGERVFFVGVPSPLNWPPAGGGAGVSVVPQGGDGA